MFNYTLIRRDSEDNEIVMELKCDMFFYNGTNNYDDPTECYVKSATWNDKIIELTPEEDEDIAYKFLYEN